MSKTTFKPVLNAVTGKQDFNFTAKLVSLGSTVLELKNDKKTKYVLGAVDFTYPNGEAATAVTTQIFASNLEHGMKVGDSYLSTLSQGDEGRLYIRTSHLTAGNNIDISAMGSLFGAVEEVAEPAAEVDANA